MHRATTLSYHWVHKYIHVQNAPYIKTTLISLCTTCVFNLNGTYNYTAGTHK